MISSDNCLSMYFRWYCTWRYVWYIFGKYVFTRFHWWSDLHQMCEIALKAWTVGKQTPLYEKSWFVFGTWERLANWSSHNQAYLTLCWALPYHFWTFRGYTTWEGLWSNNQPSKNRTHKKASLCVLLFHDEWHISCVRERVILCITPFRTVESRAILQTVSPPLDLQNWSQVNHNKVRYVLHIIFHTLPWKPLRVPLWLCPSWLWHEDAFPSSR